MANYHSQPQAVLVEQNHLQQVLILKATLETVQKRVLTALAQEEVVAAAQEALPQRKVSAASKVVLVDAARLPQPMAEQFA